MLKPNDLAELLWALCFAGLQRAAYISTRKVSAHANDASRRRRFYDVMDLAGNEGIPRSGVLNPPHTFRLEWSSLEAIGRKIVRICETTPAPDFFTGNDVDHSF